jgi:hypothetical protein
MFVCCLTTVVHCAIDAKDENKEFVTLLNFFHRYLDMLVLLVYVTNQTNGAGPFLRSKRMLS